MNSWAPEHYVMGLNPGMNPAMMLNPMHMPPPLSLPNMHMIRGPEWNQAPNTGQENFIGPIPPENQDTTMELQDEESNEKDQGGGDQGGANSNQGHNQGQRSRQSNYQGGNHNRESRWNKNNKDGRSDRGDRNDRSDRSDRGRRPRSQDRDGDRGDRSRSDRRNNRERNSRFSNRDSSPVRGVTGLGRPGSRNMMMPGIMPYGNNLIPGQPVDNMPNMPHIPNIGNVPGMNTSPNMMGNLMMDQNTMMAQLQMMIQPIFTQAGVLLAPLPGVAIPPRREQPLGCKTVFIGGFPVGISIETINEIFQRFGVIDDIQIYNEKVCLVRFLKQEMAEQACFFSGFRFRTHDQSDNEATTLFIDYPLNPEDQYEAERRTREPTPPRIEPFTTSAFTALTDKIKSDTDFAESAPTLAGWLEKGECNKKNANSFYSLIQACNNQVRRLYNEKMLVDEEFQNLKTSMKEKYAHIIFQFEQVAKILSAAKHKRASDHFSKQQRRNIDMWLKMTEDLENIKEEVNALFDDSETEKSGQKMISAEKYEELKGENEALVCELEGYRNEAHLAKNEAERKFEMYKAHFIAQQALHGGRPPQQGGVFPPLPPPTPMPTLDPSTPDDNYMSQSNKQEAKLVAMLTAFLLAHPLGATIDYLATYVRSMVPNATQSSVISVLLKNGDVFSRKAKDKWTFVLFDIMRQEGH